MQYGVKYDQIETHSKGFAKVTVRDIKGMMWTEVVPLGDLLRGHYLYGEEVSQTYNELMIGFGKVCIWITKENSIPMESI